MRPTRLAIVVAVLGLAVALLPAAVDPRLWALWPVYLGGLVLALGADALMVPKRAGVKATLAMPGTLYIGEEEEAVFLVGLKPRSAYEVEVDDEEMFEAEADAGGILPLTLVKGKEMGIRIKPAGTGSR